MSSNRAWSTSRSSATDRPGRRGAVLLAALVAGAALGAAGPARAATPKKGPLLTFVSESHGERTVEVFDLRFASFETRFRHTRAPKSESPTGERIEVVQKRQECSCVRLADSSKIKMPRIRQIEIAYPEGGRVALVRITARDGDIREYPATDLFGGDGLFPPRFVATVEGQPMEFPLVLPDAPGAGWPEERLVRMIVFRSGSAPPPPKKKKETSASH